MKMLLIITASLILLGCKQKQRVHKTGLEGTTLPECSFLLQDSVTYVNKKALDSKKPFVLFYFSPYCPYCRAQMRDILRNEEELKQIQFYALTTWSFQEMRKFSKEFDLPRHSNIKVGVDYKNFLIHYYNPKGVPLLVIYGADRKLKGVFNSMTDVDQIKEMALN